MPAPAPRRRGLPCASQMRRALSTRDAQCCPAPRHRPTARQQRNPGPFGGEAGHTRRKAVRSACEYGWRAHCAAPTGCAGAGVSSTLSNTLNQQRAAVARRPGARLGALRALRDRRRPRLPDGERLHRASSTQDATQSSSIAGVTKNAIARASAMATHCTMTPTRFSDAASSDMMTEPRSLLSGEPRH